MLDAQAGDFPFPGSSVSWREASPEAPRSRARAAPRRAHRPLPARAATRVFDVGFALAVSVATAPIVLAAMIAIRIESPGPALFRQRRMGLNGKEFELFKLRGMYVDARERFPELFDYAGASPDGPEHYYFHREHDPRLTRVGRVLRRYSVDELPNFWNVLLGDMSIVGPRPEIPELAHLYGSRLDTLLSVRPGITSPAKACGRDSLSFAETLTRELEFVERHTFRDDLRTIALTARSVTHAADVC
jgi:lipopolysaccharide/colanic/teichoic acid biosynthesis glycosyltransferase